MRLLVVSALAASGCIVASTPGMQPTMGGTSSGGGSGPGGMVTIPNVVGMTHDQAVALFRQAGSVGEVSNDDNLCGSLLDGKVIELGTVCYQTPSPGTVQTSHSPVGLRTQTENPWHGNIGKVTEWRLMPQIVGMKIDDARATMRKVGFTRDDQVVMQWVDEPGCKPLTVCRTNPDALDRAGLASTKIVYVANDPNAAPPPPPAPPAPTDNGSPPTAPVAQQPAKEKAPEPFF